MALPERAERLIERAKKSKPKGDFFTYNRLRQELRGIPLSSKDYEEAVRRLADALRV